MSPLTRTDARTRGGPKAPAGRVARLLTAVLVAVVPILGAAAAEETPLPLPEPTPIVSSPVVDLPPVAAFTYSCSSKRVCTFDASGSSDPEGGSLSYVWYFSDGWAATGAVVTHTFERPIRQSAPVTVMLRAVDAAGNVGELTQTVQLPKGK